MFSTQRGSRHYCCGLAPVLTPTVRRGLWELRLGTHKDTDRWSTQKRTGSKDNGWRRASERVPLTLVWKAEVPCYSTPGYFLCGLPHILRNSLVLCPCTALLRKDRPGVTQREVTASF